MATTTYNVTTDLGANNLVNDNSTDNVAQWNAAIAALTAPYTFYFPGGLGYKFASTPNAIPSNVTLYGDSIGQTVINGTRVATGGGAVFSATSSSNVTIRDLTFTTPDTANACDQCLLVTSAVNLTLVRVKFSNGNSSLIRSGATAQVSALQCEFTSCYRNFSSSGVSGLLTNSTFTDCWFHDNNATGDDRQHCIYLNGIGTGLANVVISGCVFQNNGGSAIALKGDVDSSPGSYATSISILGCQFTPNGTHGTGCISSQKVQGLSVVGNTANVTNGAAFAVLFDNENFTITGNNYTCSVALPGVFLGLSYDGAPGNAQGVISNNTASVGTDGNGIGNMSFGLAISINDAHNILISDNIITGYYIGVGIYNQSAGLNADITIRNNQFLYPRNWTHTPDGGHYFFNLPNTFFGVALDGTATRVQVLDNYCERLTYELFFTIYTYTGQTDQVKFRSGSWAGDNTNTFGFTGGALPTNCVQFGAASVPFSATNTGHGYITSTI